VTLAIRGVDRGIAIPLGRGVAAQGGLCVLATGRPGVALADEPVRAWCGQRGSPGSTRFLLSLDDPETFGADAAGWLSRRWREKRQPIAISDAACEREIRHRLAALESERRAALRAFAARSGQTEAQRRIAAARRAGLRGAARGAIEDAWSAHLGRIDALVRAGTREGGAFSAATGSSFEIFLAQTARAESDAREIEPPALQLVLEQDPGFTA
jgi:preprotein translocase subunit SecA